jgi:hypothetical protein
VLFENDEMQTVREREFRDALLESFQVLRLKSGAKRRE